MKSYNATIQIYITKMETVDKSYGLITYLKMMQTQTNTHITIIIERIIAMIRFTLYLLLKLPLQFKHAFV